MEPRTGETVTSVVAEVAISLEVVDTREVAIQIIRTRIAAVGVTEEVKAEEATVVAATEVVGEIDGITTATATETTKRMVAMEEIAGATEVEEVEDTVVVVEDTVVVVVAIKDKTTTPIMVALILDLGLKDHQKVKHQASDPPSPEESQAAQDVLFT